jgi:hypothetical protein
MNLSRLAFTFILAAAVLPLLALDKMSDPLAGTAWSAVTTANSSVIAYGLSLVYAFCAHMYARRRISGRTVSLYLLGAVTGLIPGLFYLVVSPISTSPALIVNMLAIGLASGAIFGGPGLLMLFSEKESQQRLQ